MSQSLVSSLTAGLGAETINRVAAEECGDQHAITDNATEQGRAKSRRISAKVLHK